MTELKWCMHELCQFNSSVVNIGTTVRVCMTENMFEGGKKWQSLTNFLENK